MRKIYTLPASSVPSLEARIFCDAEWDEYRARVFYRGAPLWADSGYHTDDKADAIDTARVMLAEAIAHLRAV